MVGRPYRAGQGYLVDGSWIKKTEEKLEELRREIIKTQKRRSYGSYQPSLCSAINGTGAYRQPGEVVKIEIHDNLDSGQADEVFNENLYFKWSVYTAKAPTGKREDVHGIVTDPLEDDSARDYDQIGRVILHGSAPALVDIVETGHRYAKIVEDEYILKSTSAASEIRIIETGLQPGIRRARVMMGAASSSIVIAIVHMQDVFPNAIGQFQVWQDDGSGPASTDTIMDAWHDWMHGSEMLRVNTQCVLQYFPTEGIWRVVQAECG